MKNHVLGGHASMRTWCGRDGKKFPIIVGNLDWEDPTICGSCYQRAEQAAIRDVRRAEAEKEKS